VRLVRCKGCQTLIPLAGRRSYCRDCLARFEEREEELNLGYGPLTSLRNYMARGESGYMVDVSFVLSMRDGLDREREDCESAVRIALRDGARAVTEHHEAPLASEVRALEDAADRAAASLSEGRREKLLADCDRTLTKPRRTRARAAGTVDGSPRRRREEERDVHSA